MAFIVEKTYTNSGIYYLKIPGIAGNIVNIQVDAHGAGGGGTVPVGTSVGAPGGFGGHIAGMFAVPGGSEFHIGVGSGGETGQPSGTGFNGGLITGSGYSQDGKLGGGGKGGDGYSSSGSIQGGGGGALSSVLITFPGANFSGYSHDPSDWPIYRDNFTTTTSLAPLIWAGGGGGAPGAINNAKLFPNGGVNGLSGLNVVISRIGGRSYWYANTVTQGTIITTAQYADQLYGIRSGGGGCGGAADYNYGELTDYEYASSYLENGGNPSYIGYSPRGGPGGKSGINGFYLSSVTWHETPELYPGGSWIGSSRALETISQSGGSTGWSGLTENIGLNNTKNFATSLSRYGFGGPESGGGGPGRVTIKYEQLAGQPNEIDSFLTDYDAEVDTFYTTRNTVTILGINKAVPATVSGAADAYIIVNGNTIFVGNTVQVVNGAVLGLYVKSSDAFNTTKEVYLTVGDPGLEVQSRYILITKATPPAFANPWDFTDVPDALPNKLISSTQEQITGLATGSAVVNVSASSTSGVPVDVELYIANIKKEAPTGVIYNGETIQLKLISSATAGDKITALVTIGDGNAVDWVVTTTANIDTGPEFYNFTNVDNIVGGSEVESNTVVITGINYTANVTASNPDNIPVFVSVNGGDWKNPLTETVTIENNETLQLKLTAPNQPRAEVKTKVIVGTNAYGQLDDEWIVKTSVAGDTTPDQFLFVDRNNQKATTTVYSNQVIIRGITSPAPLSITIPADFTGTQPQFSINNGTDWFDITGLTHPPSPAPQTISNNVPLMLRLRTGSYGSNSALINVNIGGVTDQWAVTPLPEAPVSDQASTWYGSLGKADGYSIGTVISVFRDSSGTFGVLDGSPESRYPGFIECDGRTLNVVDYPDLFDVIGNIYGGTGSKSDESPYVYAGTFKLPDYRNRKLYGTGRVDGNVSSSPSVPTVLGPDGTDTGSSTTVGSQGGFWFIDKIDARGPYPREQLFEDEISSEFFRLGTIRTSGYENISGSTTFNIAGTCTGTVGPLRETIVKTPEHFHEMVSSALSETENGLMAWGSPGLLPGQRIYSNSVSSYYPGAPNAPTQGGLFSPDWRAEFTYNNYWASAKADNIPLNNTNNSDAPGKVTTGGQIRLGAIDLGDNTAASVIGFSPGGTLTHSHYVSKTPFGASVFGYGNVNGPGTAFGSTSLSETADVEFSASELALLSDLGTFTLSTRKAIVPTAKFRPNITVPLISKYYRAKYIIKAF